jgi:signal transduction histidine kinase
LSRRGYWVLLPLLLSLPAAARASLDCDYQFLGQPANVGDMLSRSGWQAMDPHGAFGYHTEPLWIRCRIPRGSSYAGVQNPAQKQFDVHFASADGRLLETYASGRVRRAAEQPVHSPEFYFPVTDGAAWLLIQDDSVGPKNYPLVFASEDALAERNAALTLLHGMYYGAISVFVLYGVLAALVTRQAVFFYYALYAMALMLFLASKDGFGRMFLWPQADEFLRYWPGITLAVTLVAFSQFAIRFLHARRFHPRLTLALNIAQVAVVGTVVLRLLTDHYLTLVLEPYLVIAACTLFLGMGLLRAVSGSFAGKVFLLGNAFMLAGSLTYALVLIGIVDTSLLATYSVHLGSFFEVVILSTTLGYLTRAARRRSIEYRHRTLELSRRVRQLQSATELAEEHRQLQRSLHNAQKQRTLGQMAGGIGHEFNNILAGILGFTELAQQRLDDRVQLSRYLEEIRTASRRASDLVRQLLQYSRNTPQRGRDIDFVDTVSEACELLRSSLPPTLTIRFDTEQSAPPARRMHMDPQSIQQILVNLCLNASEAMSQRGIIQVTVRSRAAEHITCASCLARFSGDYNVIEVSDHGPGLTGNAQEIFEPFHTTKNVGDGSGLGLSVVHGIVHESGGHVRVANRGTGGLRVSVYLRGEAPSLPRRDTARILIIQDNPSVASYLTSLLDGESWEVASARQATEALEHFMANPDGYDLVIADEALKHGSGLELAQDLLALRPDLPIIMTTHHTDDIGIDGASQSGIRAVFSKPIEADLMVAKIRAILAAEAADA